MYLLDKLWRGDITPSERYIRPDSEFKRKAKEFCDAAERLVEGLSPEGKNHWEDVERLKHDMNMLSEEDIFIYGFRMGARMILDVVSDHKGQFYEIGVNSGHRATLVRSFSHSGPGKQPHLFRR